MLEGLEDHYSSDLWRTVFVTFSVYHMYSKMDKNKNLKTKNRDRKKEHIQGYRDLNSYYQKA